LTGAALSTCQLRQNYEELDDQSRDKLCSMPNCGLLLDLITFDCERGLTDGKVEGLSCI